MTVNQLQTPSGKFTIAAFDQRSSLAKLLGVDPQTQTGKETIVHVKQVFMETFSPLCSATLVDPEFGLEILDKKNPQAGLLLSLERSSYTQENPDAMPLFYDGWGIREIAQRNAAAKLLLFYHPQSAFAKQKRELVAKLFEESRAAQIPFLLEIITHPLPTQSHEAFAQEFLETQKIAAHDFDTYCNVLKLEAPLLPFTNEAFDEYEFGKRCDVLSSVAKVPWIILSRGMEFERFIRVIEVSMKHGASGFAVGRAVWKEISEYITQQEQDTFIRTVAAQRMKALVDLCLD